MKHLRGIILQFGLISIGLFPIISRAQTSDTLHIKGVQKIAKGEELKINAGTQVRFASGAALWIEGSLFVTGDSKAPVVFASENPDEPGTGIIINGNEPNARIVMHNASFNGLLRPLSFEPFWSRKTVSIENLNVKNSVFNEAVIFVAAPLVNLNKPAIQFELSNSNFYHNNAGIIIENAGSSGITYTLDNLVFQNNKLLGNDNSLGILNINIASPYNPKNLNIGNLVFINNTVDNKTLGLSLGGGSQETVAAKAIYSNNNIRPVFDNQQDARLPLLEAPIKDIGSYPLPICFIESINHTKGNITLKGKKLCKITKVVDSNFVTIPATFNVLPDSILINYQEGLAAYVILENGMEEKLPAIAIQDTSTLNAESTKPPIVLQDTLINPTQPWKKTYEVGLMGGLAFYVGDIKHRFGIPGVFDWSSTAFVQYNKSPKVSYRFGFSRTNIGMHNPTAALMLFRSADTYGLNNNGNFFLIPSFENNFKTKMYNLDADLIYYFLDKHDNSKSLNNSAKGQWIPAIGTGVSLSYFEPYRMVVYSNHRDTAEFIKLRPLGLEGQNFLSSKRAYLPITLNLNISFQLVYAYKNWRFRYEIKTIMSFSDYLDDFGQGYAYGGNYEEWKKSVGNIDLPIDKHTGKQITLEQQFTDYTSTVKRTTNLLPDMYFPQHIGVSYVLGR